MYTVSSTVQVTRTVVVVSCCKYLGKGGGSRSPRAAPYHAVLQKSVGVETRYSLHLSSEVNEKVEFCVWVGPPPLEQTNSADSPSRIVTAQFAD